MLDIGCDVLSYTIYEYVPKIIEVADSPRWNRGNEQDRNGSLTQSVAIYLSGAGEGANNPATSKIGLQ